MGMMLALALALGSLGGPPQDATAVPVDPAFQAIDAGAVRSADIEIALALQPKDLVRTADGRITLRPMNPGEVIYPRRKAQVCKLDRRQIVEAIETLKRSQALSGRPAATGTEYTIRFRLRGKRELTAVIATGDGGLIFFDDRAAVLGGNGQAALLRIVGESGCDLGSTGEPMPERAAAPGLVRATFEGISADSFASAEVENANPVLTALTGKPPEYCSLSPAQMAESIAILKTARPVPNEDGGVTTDFMIHFKPRDGSKTVFAIIGFPGRTGPEGVIAFAGQRAMLGNVHFPELRRIAMDAGCKL